MKLIIAEKPSMMKKYQNAIKDSDVFFAASVGHIEGLISPEKYFGKEKMYWNELVKKFPFIPEEFKLEITKPDVYTKIVEKLKNATEIILCCDPDREGELIHRNIIDIATKEGYVKTSNITRVWLHAETTAGIQEGFNKRKSYFEYDGFYKAAYTRMIIDWLIGIQLTVLYSTKFGKPGNPISIGRVQSWLLSEIVERYNHNTNFIEKDYFRITFTSREGVKFNYVDLEGKIIDIFDEKLYYEIMNSIKEKKLEISKIEKKPFTEYAPSLYDLSTLQKDAAKKYGITPEKTLEIAQKLYEEYNLISYPRTDCNVISEEEAKEIKKSFELVEKFSEYKEILEAVRKENENIEIGKKYIGKLKGHYAIIPVFNYDKIEIPELEKDIKKIFDLIVKRFLAALLPPVEGEKTVIKANVENNKILIFISNIINIKNEGYKKYFKEKEDEKEDENTASVDYKENDKLEGKYEGKKDKTKPKELFNDTSIIALMEKAHLSVQDEKLRESLKEASGIGTAATRSSFIPILLQRDYIIKNQKFYIPTQKGLELYSVLPEELKKADFSAKLEYEFSKMVDKEGKTTRELVLETKEFLENIFTKINNTDKIFTSKTYGKCPKCGNDIIKGRTGYGCKNYKDKSCDFYIAEEIAGKKLSEKEIIDVVEKGRTSLIKGFTGKNGKFDAYLKLNEENKVTFDFEKDEKDKIICPICSKGEMIERDKFWGCSGYKDGCKFSIAKEIAGAKISLKTVKEICKKKKSGKLKFTGKKGEFEAELIIKPDNTVGFNF